MKLKFDRLVYFAAVFILCSATVHAQTNVMTKPRPVERYSEWKPHVGFLLGASQPESSGITAAETGIDVGFQPYIPFGLAAEFSHARIDNGEGGRDRNTIWAKGSYNFGGSTVVLKNSYIGLGLGAVFKTDGVSAAIAPLLGFDIPVKEMQEGNFSLGANLKYAVVADNEVDTMTVSGILKYWY
jgi:hypothetical protein